LLGGETVATMTPSLSDTRSLLIEAGLDVFGEFGYAAASTRQLAERAGTNLAAIPYYFGGKEGLYREVVRHITDHLRHRVLPPLETMRQRLAAGELDAAAAAAALEQMLTGMIEFIIGAPQARRFARIIAREQMDPSAAFDIIFEAVWQPALTLAAALLARVRGAAAPTRTDSLQAYALFGQVLGFRVARETIVRFVGLEGYSTAETAEIREIILQQTRAILAGLQGERP